jgi:hypothetical protein
MSILADLVKRVENLEKVVGAQVVQKPAPKKAPSKDKGTSSKK